MLLRSTLIAIVALPALISGRHIPAARGTIGGVPRGRYARDDVNLREVATGHASTPQTPGKLRVVENSGVCGEVFLSR